MSHAPALLITHLDGGTDRLLGEHGIARDGVAGRREFGRRMEARRAEENDAEALRAVRRGWKLGAEDFLDSILQKMEVRPGEGHARQERDETEEARAARIVREELERLGWTRADLKQRKKGDSAKVVVARRLRAETAVSLKWIAETWTHVANRLYHLAE
ncbi:MAG: hypothetical protein ACR2ID_09520 [Chthoniobacterales bacterium]